MSHAKIPLYCGLIQLTTSHVHLVCTSLSALIISAVCCEGLDICGQGQQTASFYFINTMICDSTEMQ